jgi:hypothetical protein
MIWWAVIVLIIVAALVTGAFFYGGTKEKKKQAEDEIATVNAYDAISKQPFVDKPFGRMRPKDK